MTLRQSSICQAQNQHHDEQARPRRVPSRPRRVCGAAAHRPVRVIVGELEPHQHMLLSQKGLLARAPASVSLLGKSVARCFRAHVREASKCTDLDKWHPAMHCVGGGQLDEHLAGLRMSASAEARVSGARPSLPV